MKAEAARAAARRHLLALAATPRPAGSDAEARARRYCAEELRAHGYRVHVHDFTYSAAPGRWATPAGGLLSLATLAVASALGGAGQALAALAVLAAALLALALGGAWLARRGVVSLGITRATGTNLVATCGDGSPAVWLVAHLDSKSQPVPMLARAGGITAGVAIWIVAIALAVAQLAGEGAPHLWWIVGLAGALAALPVVASVVGANSPGALDNASGVATVLLAAASLAELSPASCVGVLITSAEELGLAGARAWVADQGRAAARTPVINCDGLDDEGTMTIMYSGRRPERLLAPLADAAAALATPARARRLLPGILTDSVAFADAGWPAVTVSRGSARTLLRIHRPADSLDALMGDGVARTAPVVARAAAHLARAAHEEA